VANADIAIDLVECLIVAVPDLDSLANLAPALSELVASGATRILDAVVIQRERDGAVNILELDDIAGLSAVPGLDIPIEGLLTDTDLELTSLGIRPGTVGLVLVTEDRWAEQLAAAAARTGGSIVAGERIPAGRIEAAVVEILAPTEEVP
jgi:hypothetical protein